MTDQPLPAPAGPQWEDVNATTSRLPVPGGWLYRVRAKPGDGSAGECVVFVPAEFVQ